MSLNEYRDEAAGFLQKIGKTDEPIQKILGWLDEEVTGIRQSLNDRQKLAHQVYDTLFLLFELAARYGLDLDEQWIQGRQRKRDKYCPRDDSNLPSGA